MLQPLPSTQIAYATAAAASLLPTATNHSHVDVLEKLHLLHPRVNRLMHIHLEKWPLNEIGSSGSGSCCKLLDLA